MKDKSYLLKENIDNLVSLWRTVSIPFQSYFQDTHFDYCLVENSQWPNRLWFNRDLDAGRLSLVMEKLRSLAHPLLIPYWDIYKSNSYELLEDNGFRKLFEQVAMSLPLTQPFYESGSLQFITVSNSSEAALWSEVFMKAFGYRISPPLLSGANENTSFLIAYHQKEALGTGILHKTKDIAGIHAIGVVPEMRKKGFAEEIMKYLLNRSIKEKLGYATLQASEMGKGLYFKLGFEEQFRIKNYSFNAGD